MAKIQIKSERLTPFGGLFSIMEQFDTTLSSVIDSILGLRCGSFGYQYSEIILSFAFLLNQSDEGLAGFRAVGLRLLHLVVCAELVKEAVYQPAAVLQQVGIRWIAYLGVAACASIFIVPPRSLPSSSVCSFFGLLPSVSASIRVSMLKKS